MSVRSDKRRNRPEDLLAVGRFDEDALNAKRLDFDERQIRRVGGHDHRGKPVVFLADDLKRFDAVESWHVKIHEDNVQPLGADDRDSLFAAGCLKGVEPFPGEDVVHGIPPRGIVVGNQDRRGQCFRFNRPGHHVSLAIQYPPFRRKARGVPKRDENGEGRAKMSSPLFATG